jgi:hypothetical protein
LRKSSLQRWRIIRAENLKAKEREMGIVSIPKRKFQESPDSPALEPETRDWVEVAAGGSLLAGGLLLLSGQRRAGLVMAVAGAALTLLGEQDTVREWWEQFPGYVDRVQNLIGRVQGSMDELSVTRRNLEEALTGTGK